MMSPAGIPLRSVLHTPSPLVVVVVVVVVNVVVVALVLVETVDPLAVDCVEEAVVVVPEVPVGRVVVVVSEQAKMTEIKTDNKKKLNSFRIIITYRTVTRRET